MNGKIDKPLFLYLTLGFIIFTIIGTLSHEFGHYIVAKLLGYNASINYASTSWLPKHPLQHISYWDSVLVSLGGPIQTMLTGTLATLFLWFNRAKFKASNRLSFGQWVWIFLSLFWLRQTMNFAVLLFSFLIKGIWSESSDEAHLEYYFKLPQNSIAASTALIGCVVLACIFFAIIPKNQRLAFLCSGLLGGCLGYYLWLESLGKMIMP